MDYWTAILLGLAGSLHCAGMCGPLALALPTASSQRAGLVLGRVAYNLGRVATYSLMGLIFGLAGHSVVLAGVQRWLSIALGLTVIAGWLGSRRLAASLPVTRLVNRLKSSPFTPSGKPGKFSTMVVVVSRPPGCLPVRTSGERLARAV